MGESFLTGLALGAGAAFAVAAAVFFWIIIRNLRPMGWAILCAGIAFLLSRL